jgi:hypothetical protein
VEEILTLSQVDIKLFRRKVNYMIMHWSSRQWRSLEEWHIFNDIWHLFKGYYGIRRDEDSISNYDTWKNFEAETDQIRNKYTNKLARCLVDIVEDYIVNPSKYTEG